MQDAAKAEYAIKKKAYDEALKLGGGLPMEEVVISKKRSEPSHASSPASSPVFQKEPLFSDDPSHIKKKKKKSKQKESI